MASRRVKPMSTRSTRAIKRHDAREGNHKPGSIQKEDLMEAKVDVRKLQVLNDRINQTIEALNQVRVSVHGLGHTSGFQPQVNPFFGQGLGLQNPYGLGMQSPYGLGAQMHPGLGGTLGGQSMGIPSIGGLGFQHSPFTPYLNPFTTPVNPGIGTPWGQTPYTGTPWGGLGGVAGGLGGGLFHSTPDFIDKQIAEVRASDPFRITQTFPFVIY